jgi:hypothetical protein
MASTCALQLHGLCFEVQLGHGRPIKSCYLAVDVLAQNPEDDLLPSLAKDDWPLVPLPVSLKDFRTSSALAGGPCISVDCIHQNLVTTNLVLWVLTLCIQQTIIAANLALWTLTLCRRRRRRRPSCGRSGASKSMAICRLTWISRVTPLRSRLPRDV